MVKKKYKKTGVSVTFVPFPTQSFPGCVNVRRWAICCFHARTTEGIGNEHFGLFFFLSLSWLVRLLNYIFGRRQQRVRQFFLSFRHCRRLPVCITMWFLSLILPFEEAHEIWRRKEVQRYTVDKMRLCAFCCSRPAKTKITTSWLSGPIVTFFLHTERR